MIFGGRWKRPLKCKEVKQILHNLGFAYRNTEGSHENWIKETGGHRRKVTVDCPKAPFSHMLIGSMARQAGVSVKDFYKALND
jgi:predicted RNA binding protein YcfA (HicA-like mRNA interferase family)